MAAILVPFRPSFTNTASALILVAVIVAGATLGNRISGIMATISATVSFDFFLTRPYEQLAITRRQDIETAVSLFVVGIIVTELAACRRHHHETAVEEADFVALIHDVSELPLRAPLLVGSLNACETTRYPAAPQIVSFTSPARPTNP